MLIEHSDVQIKQSFGTKFRRLSTRMLETVQKMESAVYKVQRAEIGVARGRCRSAGPKEQPHLERRGRCLVPDGIYLSLEGMVKATDTAGSGSSLETRYGGMLAYLFEKETLRVLIECVRKCVLIR